MNNLYTMAPCFTASFTVAPSQRPRRSDATTAVLLGRHNEIYSKSNHHSVQLIRGRLLG